MDHYRDEEVDAVGAEYLQREEEFNETDWTRRWYAKGSDALARGSATNSRLPRMVPSSIYGYLVFNDDSTDLFDLGSESRHRAVQLLPNKGAKVNVEGGVYGNALEAVSLGGHEAVVRLLLSKDADSNVQGGVYGNALQAASHGGHEAVVRLLLDKGADVDARGGEYGNALQAASWEGRRAVVSLLFDEDADLNAQGL
ncbi:hypothetical protein LTR49_027944 [Elasticomyces elasticus]|nr:hypothetical protein LTR49_027944 [Elasticomyces elasticus]